MKQKQPQSYFEQVNEWLAELGYDPNKPEAAEAEGEYEPSEPESDYDNDD